MDPNQLFNPVSQTTNSLEPNQFLRHLGYDALLKHIQPHSQKLAHPQQDPLTSNNPLEQTIDQLKTSEDLMAFSFGSPFFDYENFPVTNPPIYEPDVLAGTMRRRVSILNGQIGQLGQFRDIQFDPELSPEDATNISSDRASNETPTPQQAQTQGQQQQVQGQQQQVQGQPQQVQGQTQQIQGQPPQIQLLRTQTPVIPPASSSHFPQQNNPLMMMTNSMMSPSQLQARFPQGNVMLPNNGNIMLMPSQPVVQPQHFMVQNYAPNGLVPGTAAWKRARLLERNRVAASKCRQKKKIAQQQLQEEAANAIKECKTLRKRVAYLESTLSKVKDVMRIHMKGCNGSSVSIDILEDFLKLDEEHHGKDQEIKTEDK